MTLPCPASRGFWPLAGVALSLCAFASAPLSGKPRDVSPIHTPGGLRAAGLEDSDLLLSEFHCLACHESDGARASLPRRAPILSEVGSRISPTYLREFLGDPARTKPGTAMPDLLGAYEGAEKKAAIDALVHFLASLRRASPTVAVESDPEFIAVGERLFHSVGCVACHDPQAPPLADTSASPADDDLPAVQGGVPLGDLARKTTVGELAAFLRDPLAVRPSGRMPSLLLADREAEAIAMYLLRGQLERGGVKEEQRLAGLRTRYYEFSGGIDSVEKLFDMQAKSRSRRPGFDIEPRDRDEFFGFVFTGLLEVAEGGKYTFSTHSDDGSRLYVDGRLVVDNDGVHGGTTKSGDIELTAGEHAIRVAFFENGGGEILHVWWQGPGFERQKIPAAALSHIGQAMQPVGYEKLEIDPAKAARGRELFGLLGCASCHEATVDGEKLSSRRAARPLSELRLAEERSCLADTPPAELPRFALSEAQRRALRHVLQEKTFAGPISPAERVDRALAAFNCYACHPRDGIGGPPEARQPYFLPTVEADLGEEGRLAPPLDGVGDKLRTEWLSEVLHGGGKARPYIATRMPQFGEDNVGWLAAALHELDARETPGVDPGIDLTLARAGRKLVGNRGMSCITCHTYGKYESLGLPALDLAQMPGRLRKAWYFRYMIDPQAYKPGTRMPAFWPERESTLPDVLGGDTSRQLEAIWSYLSRGESPKIPHGLTRIGQELVPDEEPIIYRHWIDGVGPRAIAVGYPEEVSLAFDASELRLALVWRGSFIDASRHRSGRGAGFVPPAGRDVRRTVGGPPLAILESLTAPWSQASGKEAGYRFRGYRLDERRRPIFLYDFGDVHVEDHPRPRIEQRTVTIVRQLRLRSDAPPSRLYLRAAIGGRIDADPEGTYAVDDRLQLRFSGLRGERPLVRSSGGRQELLVPIRFRDGEASLTEEIEW